MKKTGFIILAVVILVVLLVLTLVFEIMEFFIGIIVLIGAVGVLFYMYRTLKDKF